MRRLRVLRMVVSVALMLLTGGAAYAADTGSALERARQLIETADFRASGHLVRVDGGGKRTSYAIALKAHWFPGVLRVEAEITAPAAARERVLLEMRPGGEDSIRVAHPGDHAARTLPLDAWSDGPLGPAFSYEDLMEAPLFWAHQTVLAQAKYGARECDVIRSTPGAADRTNYAEVQTWLDQTIEYPVHAEKTAKKGGSVKEFTYFGLRKNEGVWSASQVEVKVRGQAGSTLLVIERGTPHAHLGLKDFRAEGLSVF